MWEELENGLAWFKAAPGRWVTSAKKDLTAAAEWIWEVLQGDFAEEQTTAQVITGTVVSMIPFVDQICDVRDVVANSKKINADTSNKMAWVALALTLLGLFPTLGSLGKGCFKILFAYGRKYTLRAGKHAFDTDLWMATKPFIETGIRKLNEFLARPEVRKAIAALKWDNVYMELAKLARKVAGEINVSSLMKAMDSCIDTLKQLIDLVQKFGTAAMGTKAGELLKSVMHVRNAANAKLAEILKPVQDWMNKLARRLEVEADMNYRAYTNVRNPHAFKKPSLDEEIAALKKDQPPWVDVRAVPQNPALKRSPTIPADYPDISASGKPPLTGKFDTFHTIDPLELPAGTKIYRVIDPASSDNSICWMSEAEFRKLKSKDDWRRRFAVWASWNSNGEVVTYIVPPNSTLKVWEGVVGSQILSDSGQRVVAAGAGGKKFVLEGGARQIVLDPTDLDKAHLGKRGSTGWPGGYSNFGEKLSMVGVPTLKNNWYEKK
jgi:hypothetical protein